MTEVASLYRYSCLIPFHYSDTAGVMFFGHVFSLAHQAFESFVIYQLKYPWSFWFQNSEWIVPIKHTEADYFSPIQAGTECHIDISLLSLSTSSFTLNYDFHQQTLSIKVKTVHVFCDSVTLKKIIIPPVVLTQFNLFLINKLS